MRNLGLSLDDFKKKSDFLILTLIALISLSFALIWTYFSYLFVFAIILFSATIILFFKKPDWFLYFFAFSRISLDALKLVYFEDIKIGMHWSLSIDGIIGGIFIFCGVIYLFKKKEIRIWELPGIKPFFIFLLICLISLFYSLDKVLGLRYFIRYLNYFLIYILGVNILDTKEKNYKMIIAIFLSSFIPLSIGLFQFIALKENYWHPYLNRIYATTYNPNQYAYYLNIILLFAFTMYLYTDSWRNKIYLFLLTIPTLISLILTYSRTGWISVIFGLSTFFLLSKGKDRYKIFLLIFLLLIIIGSTYLGITTIYRVTTLLSPGLETLGGRINLWIINFKVFLKNPLIGYGIGSWNIFSQKETGTLFPPDNWYICLMVETGFFGLITFLLIIFSLYRFFLKKYRVDINIKKKILSLGVFALIITTLVSQIGFDLPLIDNVFVYFWFIIVINYNLLTDI